MTADEVIAFLENQVRWTVPENTKIKSGKVEYVYSKEGLKGEILLVQNRNYENTPHIEFSFTIELDKSTSLELIEKLNKTTSLLGEKYSVTSSFGIYFRGERVATSSTSIFIKPEELENGNYQFTFDCPQATNKDCIDGVIEIQSDGSGKVVS